MPETKKAPVKKKPDKVKIEISAKLAEDLKEVTKEFKYCDEPEDAIYELLTKYHRVKRVLDARKANSRRRRLGNWVKFWVNGDLEEKINAIKKKMADERDDWSGLNRVEENTHVLNFLIKEHETLDAQRAVPVGGHVGGSHHLENCPRCWAPVGQVWVDDKPVYEDGEPRIVALRNDDLLRKSATDLLSYVPEFGYADERVTKAITKAYKANGSTTDELPPFLSNINLFELLGKEDSRSVRAHFNELLKRIGLEDLTF